MLIMKFFVALLDNKGALLIRLGFVVNQANKCCSCKYQTETLMKIT